MDFGGNWPSRIFWLKFAAPKTGWLWLLKSPKTEVFKVNFSPIERKGVEAIIE